MASANVDLLRSVYADWERGDYSSVEWADPDVELVIADGPGRETWRGLTEVGEGWSFFLGNWDEYRSQAEEFLEVDGERVLVMTRNHGRGKTSGLEVGPLSGENAVLFHLRGGKITRMAAYLDRWWKGKHTSRSRRVPTSSTRASMPPGARSRPAAELVRSA